MLSFLLFFICLTHFLNYWWKANFILFLNFNDFIIVARHLVCKATTMNWLLEKRAIFYTVINYFVVERSTLTITTLRTHQLINILYYIKLLKYYSFSSILPWETSQFWSLLIIKCISFLKIDQIFKISLLDYFFLLLRLNISISNKLVLVFVIKFKFWEYVKFSS